VSLLGVAGLFLLQKAEFLFAVQIVLYVGGIMVLFLFVIMLVNLDESAKLRQFNHQWIAALLAAVAVGAEGWYLLRRGLPDLPASLPDPTPGGNVERLADVLFSRYLLPFEVASILLLVAIVGSVVMAKKRI
jgi:NADH-quinone oxidoreductase subunit J